MIFYYSTICDDINNTATAEGKDSFGATVSDSDWAEVECICSDIEVTKTVDPTQGEPGTTVNFTITVENTGNCILDPVKVVDTLPTGMSYVNALPSPDNVSSVVITWDNVGPLAANGGSATINLIANIDEIASCEVWVDDSWTSQSDVNLFDSSLIWQYNTFRTIQDGVNVVCNCGTVHVREGVYMEQILINKSLSLLAESGVTINAPPSLEYYTINGFVGSWAPIIFAYGGTLSGNDVSGNDTISVVVDGFEIVDSFIPNSTGILYHNVGCGWHLGVLNNTVVATGYPPFGYNVTDDDYAEVEVEGYLESVVSNNTIIDFDIGIKYDGCSNCCTIVYNHIEWAYHTIEKIGIVVTGSGGCEPENIEIHYNFIGVECGDNIGIWNQVSDMANATFNWWSAPDGPRSPPSGDNYDPITGRIADGSGEKIVGFVHFDPWAGLEADGDISHHGNSMLILVDASNSFAYHINGTPNTIGEYKWGYGDGFYSFDISDSHLYQTPGTYTVTLRVRASDLKLYGSWMYDYSYFTVIVP